MTGTLDGGKLFRRHGQVEQQLAEGLLMATTVLAIASAKGSAGNLGPTAGPLLGPEASRLQLGLFATPVAYGMDVVAPQFQVLYSALNPLAPVIDGYRRTILLGLPPDWHLLGPGAVTSALLLAFGYVVFKRLEPGFADYA